MVVLDGINVSNSLSFTGSPVSWQVNCPLTLNTNHTAVITVIGNNGQSITKTVNFSDFSATNYQWEAEDYDYNGGNYFDNPQTNAYAGLASVTSVDNYQFDLNANSFKYRTNPLGACPSTTVAGDGQRSQFVGKTDYNIGFFGGGSWVNYHASLPGGNLLRLGSFCGRFREHGSHTFAIDQRLRNQLADLESGRDVSSYHRVADGRPGNGRRWWMAMEIL